MRRTPTPTVPARARRAPTLGAALALAGLLLAGCGSDPIDAGDAPADAPVQDFCEAFLVSGSMRDQAADLADVGTPHDIPREARSGFVAYVEAASTSSDDASRLFGDEPYEGSAFDRLTGAQTAALEAFFEYATGTCFA